MNITGKRIAILVADDFEDVELSEPREKLVRAGAVAADEPVVVDGTLITSRKPGDIRQCVDAIVGMLQ